MIQPCALRGYIEIELINIIVAGALFVSPGWMLSAIGFLGDKKMVSVSAFGANTEHHF
jgi:hypothetical protein